MRPKLGEGNRYIIADSFRTPDDDRNRCQRVVRSVAYAPMDFHRNRSSVRMTRGGLKFYGPTMFFAWCAGDGCGGCGARCRGASAKDSAAVVVASGEYRGHRAYAGGARADREAHSGS